MNQDDPTIQRIRKARHEISETNQHDPEVLVDCYLKLQKEFKKRFEPAEDVHPAQ